ncbi:MAG: hypothetical protein M1838_003549 [Thelocarpon superellum]|nr:MAG: hypothetical protein M1838_003549 [Thelocarpon superellum]
MHVPWLVALISIGAPSSLAILGGSQAASGSGRIDPATLIAPREELTPPGQTCSFTGENSTVDHEREVIRTPVPDTDLRLEIHYEDAVSRPPDICNEAIDAGIRRVRARVNAANHQHASQYARDIFLFRGMDRPYEARLRVRHNVGLL